MSDRTASKSLEKGKRIIGRENTVLGKNSEYHQDTHVHAQPQSEEVTKDLDDTPRTVHIRYSNVWLYLYTVYNII